MNLILYLLLVSVNIIMALAGRIPANPHKNIILETTLPKEYLQDKQVISITNMYKKRLLQWALIFSVIALPIIVIPYDSLTMIYFLVVMFAFIGTFYYLQILYIRKMTVLKVQNHWILPTSPILVDTKLVAHKNRKLISIWWFLPSIVLVFGGCIFSIGQIGWSNSTWLFSLISVFMTVMFLLFYYFIARFPVKPLTSEEKINQQVNDLMRHHWSVLMAVSALVMSPLSFIPTLSLTVAYERVLIVTVIYTLIILVFVLFTFFYLFSSRRKQDQLIAQAVEYRYSDEDQYWKYGIYINPNDKRILVPDRMGMNISINLGRPASKISLGVTGILVLFALIVATIPMLISDFSANPFQLVTTQQGITLTAPMGQSRKIEWKEIEHIELLEKMPQDKIKVFGTAMENYLTGEFQVNGEPSYLLVYPQESPILKIQTKTKNYYYTNKDSNLTQKYFIRIQEKGY